MRLALHIGARLLIGGALCLLLLRGHDSTPITQVESQHKLAVAPTGNLDLQLVRLFARTQGTWTEAPLTEFRALIQRQGAVDIINRIDATPINRHEAIQAALISEDIQSAQTHLTEQLLETPDDALANLRLGLLMLPAPDAFLYLERAAAIVGPIQAAAASLYGVVQLADYAPRDVALRLLEIEEWPLAEYFLTQQITLDNLDALSYAYRGFVRDQQKRDGLSDIQTALALDPGLAIGYYMQGLHHRTREAFDLSLQSFMDAALLDPDNPAFAAEVAEAYRLNGDYEQAEEWFVRGTALADGDARFVALQAAFYADNEYALAERGRERVAIAAESFPDAPQIQASWGRVLMLTGEVESAVTVLELALALDTQSPRTRLYYAEALERAGSRERALEFYAALSISEGDYQEAAQRGVLRLSQGP